VLLNGFEAVQTAKSKLASFEVFKRAGIPTVDWTTTKRIAQEWVNEGSVVLARSSDHSQGGRGITVVENGEVPVALFYTKHARHKREYRINVFRKADSQPTPQPPASIQHDPFYTPPNVHELFDVIDITQKRRRNDFDREINRWVRSYDNGWVFCRNNIVPPRDTTIHYAKNAVAALGLDFGGVDIFEKDQSGVPGCLICEVNTAPGIEGTTADNYVNHIKTFL
jgi:glutathione synthase/RimK-type ligase-like ATP-grasp enzyme